MTYEAAAVGAAAVTAVGGEVTITAGGSGAVVARVSVGATSVGPSRRSRPIASAHATAKAPIHASRNRDAGRAPVATNAAPVVDVSCGGGGGGADDAGGDGVTATSPVRRGGTSSAAARAASI